jgi:hypothetical protein
MATTLASKFFLWFGNILIMLGIVNNYGTLKGWVIFSFTIVVLIIRLTSSIIEIKHQYKEKRIKNKIVVKTLKFFKII